MHSRTRPQPRLAHSGPLAARRARCAVAPGWRQGVWAGVVAGALGLAAGPGQAQAPAAAASAPQRAALTVTVTTPQAAQWPQQLPATGSIAAWQEAIISAEGAGGRLAEVLVQVGEKVKKGQLLARLTADTLQADLAQSKAAQAEAQATLAEAQANAQRARELQPGQFMSPQQVQQALTAEQTAQARLAAAQARVQADELRLAQTRLLAPDDGVISARSGVAGGFAGPGQELMRLIRRERLEWRAEVPAAELGRLKIGTRATLTLPAGEVLTGSVRQLAPTVDTANRMGLVYVDLPAASAARAGMFARGQFEFGAAQALVLPQTAVVLRDGFSWVMRVGADSRVAATKVKAGRRLGDAVEVLAGLAPDARVVVQGGAFLADGDTVKVVAQQPAIAPPGAPVGAKPAPAAAQR